MKEKIILFFLFISFNVHSAQEAYNSNHQNESMCNSTHIDKYLGAQKAISLNITVEKSRKWGKNYIQAVTDTSSNIYIPHIILEKYKKNFNADIEVSFNNGRKGVADLSPALKGSMFEPLKNKSEFSSFTVDEELETIVWPNGADLAPEYIYFQAFKNDVQEHDMENLLVELMLQHHWIA